VTIIITISVERCIIVCWLITTWSRLTSYTPIKAGLYSTNCLTTHFSEPDTETPDIKSATSHIHFHLLWSCQKFVQVRLT